MSVAKLIRFMQLAIFLQSALLYPFSVSQNLWDFFSFQLLTFVCRTPRLNNLLTIHANPRYNDKNKGVLRKAKRLCCFLALRGAQNCCCQQQKEGT